jgi:anti-sigma factor RsiW
LSCNRMENDGMRYIDGEMTDDERSAFEEHLASCDDCRRSMEEMQRIERLTGMVRIRDPQDEFWEKYWKRIYRRLERRTAWLMIIVGAARMAANALWKGISDFGEITFGKIVAVLIGAGFVILLISVIRERCHQYRTDRYRDIER